MVRITLCFYRSQVEIQTRGSRAAESRSTLWPLWMCRVGSEPGSMVMWCDDVRLWEGCATPEPAVVAGTRKSREPVRRCRNAPPASNNRLLSSSVHFVWGRTVRSKLSTLFRAKCFNCSKLKSRDPDLECTLKSRDPFRECPAKSREEERIISLELDRECLDSLESLRHCFKSGLSDSSKECWLLGSSCMVLESLRRCRDATSTREFFPLADFEWCESWEYCESFRCSLCFCGSDCESTIGLCGSRGVHIAELIPDRQPLALSVDGSSSNTVNKIK